jgi:putative nucleotidyltransferase with HDIG domain
MGSMTLEEIVSKTTDIPTMPEAALAVVRMSGDSQTTATKVANRIAHDQSLTTRVLRLANSAYYGLPRQIVSLQDAVVMLGMRTVRHLALVASTFPWLTQPRKGYALGPQALWEHSIAVSIGAQLLARRTRRADVDEAFTAGLLHDLGKVVLSLWMEPKLADLIKRSEQDGVAFDSLERETFGFDHSQVGAYLAERWNLPDSLVDAIRYHHTPDACDPPTPIVDIVHLADILALSLGYGLGGDGLRYSHSAGAMDRMELGTEDIEMAAAEMFPAVSESLSAYGN